MKFGRFEVVQTGPIDFEVRTQGFSLVDITSGRTSRDLVITRTNNLRHALDVADRAHDAEYALSNSPRCYREGGAR